MKQIKLLTLLLAIGFGASATAQDSRNPFAPKSQPQAASAPATPTQQGKTVNLLPAPVAPAVPFNPTMRSSGTNPVIGGSVLPPPVPGRVMALPQLPPPTFEAPPVPSDLAPLPGEPRSQPGARKTTEPTEQTEEAAAIKGDEAFKKQRSEALKLREQCKFELDGPGRVELSPAAQTVVIKMKGKVVPGCARAVQSSGNWITVADQSGLTIELDIEPNYTGTMRRGKVFIASPGQSLDVSLVQRADPNFREIR